MNLERAALNVDKKNMKSDMNRLTALGLELRKQSQSLSEAQHVVVQERMKNEMLKNDIKEYHNEVTKTTGRSTMVRNKKKKDHKISHIFMEKHCCSFFLNFYLPPSLHTNLVLHFPVITLSPLVLKKHPKTSFIVFFNV